MLALLGAVLPSIFKVIDKAIPNAEEATKIKAEVQLQLMANNSKEMEEAASIVLAEAQGSSWMQRNWRPLLMMVCIFIVANNYILAPYIMLFTKSSVSLPLDQNIWDLMKIGIGGYIASRGIEKTAKEWKK